MSPPDNLHLRPGTDRQAALTRLQCNKDLFMRVKLYLRDLLVFNSSEESRARLEADYTAPYYLTSAYFDAAEVEYLLAFPAAADDAGKEKSLSFKQVLHDVVCAKEAKAAAGEARDYQLCTSHDLAPVVHDTFGIVRGFHEERAFKEVEKEASKKWRKLHKKNAKKAANQ